MSGNHIESLLAVEDEQLQKLNKIVLESIAEEKLLSQKLNEFEETQLSFGNRVADKVAQFGGSWAFIFSFLAVMIIWMGLNVFVLKQPFDAYPFILLNLVLSTIAALQAPVILMSQNRAEAKDRQRAINDYLVNMKAEIEIRNIHQKLDLLMTEQMKTLFEVQKVQVDMLGELKNTVHSATQQPS